MLLKRIMVGDMNENPLVQRRSQEPTRVTRPDTTRQYAGQLFVSPTVGTQYAHGWRSCTLRELSSGGGNFTGSEAGVSWSHLSSRACWKQTIIPQRRAPVWLQQLTTLRCNSSSLADFHWNSTPHLSITPACTTALRVEELPFDHLHAALLGGRAAFLLVGDSVDRKIWEAFNSSHATAPLAREAICMAATTRLHIPELALSWLTQPESVELDAASSAKGLRSAWDRADFQSCAPLDWKHDELGNHVAMDLAARNGGRLLPEAGDTHQPEWKLMHARPEVCMGIEQPSAIMLTAGIHVLWSYFHYWSFFAETNFVETNGANASARGHSEVGYATQEGDTVRRRRGVGPPPAWFLLAGQRLPERIIQRFETNFCTYVRQVRHAFPHSVIILRTTSLFDLTYFKEGWASSPSVNTYIHQVNEAIRGCAENLVGVDLFDISRMTEPLLGQPMSYFEGDRMHLNAAMSLELVRVLLAWWVARAAYLAHLL